MNTPNHSNQPGETPSVAPSSVPTKKTGGTSFFSKATGLAALAAAAVYSPDGRAENWQDQGTSTLANADGAYIWCYGGDADGVHVRQVYDSVESKYKHELHDGTASGVHTEGIDDAIEAYDSSINAQEICIEDVDASRDEVKFYDYGNGQSFVVNGYTGSGSISSITYLTGNPYYSGNIYDGRYFMTDYSGSNPKGAYEQFEGTSASEYYVHPTDDLVTVVVNPDTDQVFAAKNFVTGEVFKYDNASSGSATEDPLSVFGEPRSWKDASVSSTGMNSFSTLYDGTVHTIADLDSGTVVVTDPDTDADGDLDSVDCDPTDPTINSAADETCDGVDNNCDTVIDTDAIDQATFYRDADGDGVGNSSLSQEACDAPAGYVSTPGDWDDTDASVQTEPVVEPEECDTESSGGEFESGETICGPDGMGVVWSGDVDYDASLPTPMTYMADARDWLEFQDSLPIDSSAYNGLIITGQVGSGGYALAITDADMTAFLGAPPPSTLQPSTLRLDAGAGAVVDNLIKGTSEYLGEGTHELLEEAVVDADGDGVYDNVYNNPDQFPDDAGESVDSDRDGEGDNGDADDDNDGYSDAEEAAEGTDPKNDSSHPSEPEDTAGDTDDTGDTDNRDSAEDTDEPEVEDSAAGGWEAPSDREGSSCSAMTDLSPLSGPMPWVMIGAGLSAVVGRRRSSRQAA